MSTNFSLSSIVNKNAVNSDVPLLIALKVEVVDPDTKALVDTLRVVANNEDITLQGETYVASSFQVQLQESDEELPTVSITVIDITQTIQRYMQQYKGANGTRVSMMFFFAPSTVVDHIDSQYEFEVKSSSSSVADYSITWQIGAENPITLPLPARMQMKERCQWRYKGVECGYTGELPTCDLSLGGDNGCRVHDNQTRFGGLPGIQVRNL